MKNSSINRLTTAALILSALYFPVACASLNDRYWERNPAQASAACDRGNIFACRWLNNNGYLTEQYARSGMGNAMIVGPK